MKLGLNQVSRLGRSPHFRGNVFRGFHCISIARSLAHTGLIVSPNHLSVQKLEQVSTSAGQVPTLGGTICTAGTDFYVPITADTYKLSCITRLLPVWESGYAFRPKFIYLSACVPNRWWVRPSTNYEINKQCALNKELHLTTSAPSDQSQWIQSHAWNETVGPCVYMMVPALKGNANVLTQYTCMYHAHTQMCPKSIS